MILLQSTGEKGNVTALAIKQFMTTNESVIHFPIITITIRFEIFRTVRHRRFFLLCMQRIDDETGCTVRTDFVDFIPFKSSATSSRDNFI